MNEILAALENSRKSHSYEAQTAYQYATHADSPQERSVMIIRGESFERLQNQCMEAIDLLKSNESYLSIPY